VHRRRADEFIHGLLQLHGFGIAHYCEENLVVHTRLVIR
jgi:hypothetical protein